MRALLGILAATLALTACDDAQGPPPTDRVTVMTRNLYLGAELTPIIVAPAESVPFVAARAFAVLRATDFPARAGALAAEIAAARPHVVGLQETVTYRVQHPGDRVAGGTTPAADVVYDFIQLLLDSLAVRGERYRVAAADTTSDIEIPVFAGLAGGAPVFDDLRFTDGDAILVREDVTWRDAVGYPFLAYIPIEVGGAPVRIRRGWCAATVMVGDRTFRFVNTHLEDFSLDIQDWQARSLLAYLEVEALPVVLVGDFNSDALAPTAPTYGVLLAAGYLDAWTTLHPGLAGATCCQDEALQSPTALFSKRLDLVLHHPWFTPVSATIVGDEASDRLASGIWPSDHAGLVVTFGFAP